MPHKPDWEKDRAKWQARYDLSRKHPELYPQELDAIMADWEPEATPKQWADGEKAERPQRPPATDEPDCPVFKQRGHNERTIEQLPIPVPTSQTFR